MSKPKPRQKIKCGRNWPFVNSFVEFAVCGNPIFSSHGTNTTVASENDLFLWLLAFPFPDKSSSKKSDLITMMQSVYYSGNFGAKIQRALFCNFGDEIIDWGEKYENVV